MRPSGTTAGPGGRRRTATTLLVAVLVGLAAACSGATRASRSGAAPSPSGGQAAGPHLVTREVHDARKDLHAHADLKVPQLEGLSNAKAQQAVNTTLRADADKAVSEFYATVKDQQLPAPADDSPQSTSSLDGSWEQALLTPTRASIRVLLEQHLAGAAHPSKDLVTYNVDLKTGRFYTLGDLFKPGSRYLDFLSDFSRRQLALQHVGTREEVEQGTAPEAANFAGWTMAPDGIEITFGQYQVAPYVAGMPRILVSRQAMADLLAPDGPLTA